MESKKELDKFWDLSSLIPQKSTSMGRPRSTDTTEITAEPISVSDKSNSDSETVIKRYIPPHSGSSELTMENRFEGIESYEPIGALIHKVTVKKYKTAYNYYGTFLKCALEYMDFKGKPCNYVPFFSYVPMYDQMNKEQLSYYFWFRENARQGIVVQTDCGYIFTYIFELLNLGRRMDVRDSQRILMWLWNEYHVEFPVITYKLADWICDFSLLHRLPPPTSASSKIIQKVNSLKEFYICLPRDDLKRCALTLMNYCSYYDYRSSKFYTPQNQPLYDEHIVGALTVAVKYYSQDGNILSGIAYNDSTLARDIYVGAVCTSEQKYRIEVSFCSFSRSNELRYLIGDIIKYSENKLRAYIGIKSKMTVYSVTPELRDLLDKYFASTLPPRRHLKPSVERQAYDVLYDVPIKPLSLSNAKKIEASSWNTTKELIDAFDEEVTDVDTSENNVIEVETFSVADSTYDLLSPYRKTIVDMINGDTNAIFRLAGELGKLPDSIVDSINEIAFDTFGDLLIEDDSMGNYSVIDDYKDKFI